LQSDLTVSFKSGPFYICLTGFVLIISSIFTFILAPDVSPYMVLYGVVSTGFMLFSYTMAALVNPGIVMPEPDDVLDLESEPMEKA